MSNNSKPQTSGSRNIIVLKKTNELQNLREQIMRLSNALDSFGYLNNDALEDIHWADVSELLKVKEIATAKQDGGIFKCKLLFEA